MLCDPMREDKVVNRRLIVIAAICCEAWGCGLGLGIGGTAGKNGKAKFTSLDRVDCSLGCSVDRAFMVGTTNTLGVRPSGEDLRGESSDTSILVVEISNSRLTVNGEPTITSLLDATALKAGSAEIQVFKGSDLLDSLEVQVAEVGTILITLDPDSDDEVEEIAVPLMSAATEQTYVYCHAFDGVGEELDAGSGWSFQSSNEAVFVIGPND